MVRMICHVLCDVNSSFRFFVCRLKLMGVLVVMAGSPNSNFPSCKSIFSHRQYILPVEHAYVHMENSLQQITSNSPAIH
jgi:hypothetical protein